MKLEERELSAGFWHSSNDPRLESFFNGEYCSNDVTRELLTQICYSLYADEFEEFDDYELADNTGGLIYFLFKKQFYDDEFSFGRSSVMNGKLYYYFNNIENGDYKFFLNKRKKKTIWMLEYLRECDLISVRFYSKEKKRMHWYSTKNISYVVVDTYNEKLYQSMLEYYNLYGRDIEEMYKEEENTCSYESETLSEAV